MRPRRPTDFSHRTTSRRLAVLLAWPAAMAVLAGCSSTVGMAASAPTSSVGSAPVSSADAPASSAAPSASAVAGAPASTAADARPADACTLLTSDQVAAAGLTGPFDTTYPDPASDGSVPWGCTWGSRHSYAAISAEDDFHDYTADAYDVSSPAGGIGDKAVLTKRKDDGSLPVLEFQVGSFVYRLEVTMDRSETDATNAPQEADAEKALAGIIVHELAS